MDFPALSRRITPYTDKRMDVFWVRKSSVTQLIQSCHKNVAILLPAHDVTEMSRNLHAIVADLGDDGADEWNEACLNRISKTAIDWQLILFQDSSFGKDQSWQ